ncbi:MAG TPA: ribonuclease H-like domain-containing protein [Bacillota bacterium]|nr:ribonuclease H-like domain-containing protein [Bacillota bacterium]
MSGEIRSRLERLRRSGELHGAGQAGTKSLQPRQGFLFPGEEEEHDLGVGRCYLRELKIPLGQSHGRGRLAEALHCRGEALSLLDKTRDWHGFQAAGALFLDTETTGLSGGTGTWVFLIGLGWFENDSFILRQYFLRHPVEERAMLTHFTNTASRFDTLVTFNGRAFDLPLIQSRQVLAGLARCTEPKRHLDLLYCSRRLWKERLPSCSLRSLEESILGLKRYGDIPGEEIPAVYFNYLRRGETARLKQVFQHNVLDILSMVTLLVRVIRAAAGEAVEHPADFYSLGKLHLEAGETERAARCFAQSMQCGDERLAQAALQQMAAIHKKQGRWQEATKLWHELIRRRPYDLSPYVELAKYYEHQAKEYEAALESATQALSRARQRRGPASGELSLPALQHRLTRLRRKLGQ